MFPFYRDEDHEDHEEEKETIIDVNRLNNWVIKQETKISKELFKNHFSFQTPSALSKDLYITNDKEKNNELVNMINCGLKDFKKEIKKMSKEEKENEDPELMVEIVEEILKFNEQNIPGKRFKILTPNQMLRLPITLAQLKAENNSERLKNEIRQLLYSLYRSKNITKQVYNNLINYI